MDVVGSAAFASELLMFFLSQVAAGRRVQAAVCVALLVLVLVIVVLPQVDIPPTTLRVQRIVHITLSQLVGLTPGFAIRHLPSPRSEFGFLHEEPFQALPSRLSIMCVRLC